MSRDFAAHCGFSEIVQFLLEEIAPEDGAAALMLRHPMGDVYFPVAVAAGREAPFYPQRVLERYYLFATHLRFSSDEQHLIQMFDQESETSALVLAGKIAVWLFEKGPIRQDAFVCDPGDPTKMAVVMLLRPAGGADIVEVPERLLRALAASATTWRAVAAATTQVDATSTEELARRLSDFVADVSPYPPYVPLLHARVKWRVGTRGEYTTMDCVPNPLSYNCFLLQHYEELRADYIERMFQRIRADGSFRDDGPAASTGLAKAISNLCDDWVHRVCVFGPPDNELTVCARRNISRTRVSSPLFHLGSDYKSLHSKWAVIRSALEFLSGPHNDSVLVTCWIGTAGVGSDALPVGFAPGGRATDLNPVLDSNEVRSSKHIFKSEYGRLIIEGVGLDRLSNAAIETTRGIIQGTLHRTEKVMVPVVDECLPGPYRICYLEDQGIIRILAEGGVREFTKSHDYVFLVLALLVATRSKGHVTHTEIEKAAETIESGAAKKSTEVVGSVKRTLKTVHQIDAKWLIGRAKNSLGYSLAEGAEVVNPPDDNDAESVGFVTRSLVKRGFQDYPRGDQNDE